MTVPERQYALAVTFSNTGVPTKALQPQAQMAHVVVTVEGTSTSWRSSTVETETASRPTRAAVTDLRATRL